MMNRICCVSAAPLTVLVAAVSTHAGTVTLNPTRDNSLYQQDFGELSNGAGEYLFSGRTFQSDPLSRRRALMAFDIAGAVPAGSTINSVTLTLTMSKTISGSSPMALHRVTADWGEGASDAGDPGGVGDMAAPGDATWLHTFFPSLFWGTPGGDFDGTASAAANVASEGDYTWGSTAQMVADAQAWLDNPSANAGWILVGDESTSPSAKRFNSREHADAGTRPRLMIEFTPPPACAGDLDGDGDTDTTDLNILLSGFGCTGGSCPGDLDNDGDTDTTDLNIVLSDFGCAP